ncbi:hypothetical protein H4F47_10370 [Pectobacterium brasiliense]|nr:hypothetical protein [Pectobacterium brasiliense]
MKIDECEVFKVGEVWQSPRGTFYKVISVDSREATLRKGSDGSGKIMRRWWDDVVNWVRVKP